MDFTQRLLTECLEGHDACHAIECVNGDGVQVWVSHAPDTTHPDCRANPDFPLEGGDSSVEMCADCAVTFRVTGSP